MHRSKHLDPTPDNDLRWAGRMGRWAFRVGIRGACGLTGGFIALLLFMPSTEVSADDTPAKKELPSSGVVVDIDSPDRALYRIAVPTFETAGGAKASYGVGSAEVIRNDLRLISLFDVLNPKSFVGITGEKPLTIKKESWTQVGAQGVVKAVITKSGGGVRVEARFFDIAKLNKPQLARRYRGKASQLRAFMHSFANDIVKELTGEKAAFGTRLTFARRIKRGRKDVYVADFDGHGLGRVSKGSGVSMLPTFGPGGVWYSRLTRRGMFITRTGMEERPVIKGGGMNMGANYCNGRIYFSSTRSGNAEIYSVKPNGTGLKRLTKHPGIDVSPACGPGGNIAFVSTRAGGSQIFMMSGGGGGVKRLTYRGKDNQTPAWCPDPKKQLLAFTGRSGGMDIFTLNLKTGEYTRLTQGQGVNKDPAFSPDCRMIAFSSSRGGGGIYISSPEGLNQQQVVKGNAETIRWSR